MVKTQALHRVPHRMCHWPSLLEQVAAMIDMIMAVANDTVNLSGTITYRMTFLSTPTANLVFLPGQRKLLLFPYHFFLVHFRVCSIGDGHGSWSNGRFHATMTANPTAASLSSSKTTAARSIAPGAAQARSIPRPTAAMMTPAVAIARVEPQPISLQTPAATREPSFLVAVARTLAPAVAINLPSIHLNAAAVNSTRHHPFHRLPLVSDGARNRD